MGGSCLVSEPGRVLSPESAAPFPRPLHISARCPGLTLVPSGSEGTRLAWRPRSLGRPCSSSGGTPVAPSPTAGQAASGGSEAGGTRVRLAAWEGLGHQVMGALRAHVLGERGGCPSTPTCPAPRAEVCPLPSLRAPCRPPRAPCRILLGARCSAGSCPRGKGVPCSELGLTWLLVGSVRGGGARLWGTPGGRVQRGPSCRLERWCGAPSVRAAPAQPRPGSGLEALPPAAGWSSRPRPPAPPRAGAGPAGGR